MGNDHEARIVGLIQINVCLFVCLFVCCLLVGFLFRHCQQEIQNKRKLQKNMRQNTKYYITTKCTAGRSHPATTPSRMAGTRPPKLTNQDSALSLTKGASLFPMGSQERKQRPCRTLGYPRLSSTDFSSSFLFSW